MNLITNASDAIGDTAGHIRVRTGVMDVTRAFLADAIVGSDAPEGRYVFVEVQDDGCGMDKDTMARIFEPFFTTKFTGRGLGLAAVLGIVRGHNGAIRIVSAPQIGTQFRVLLPAATTPVKEEVKVAAMPVMTTGARVLVVDDEPGVRLVARESLKRAGFAVDVAEDGEDALSIVKRSPDAYDAVLLDMTMPRLSGVETLRALREVRPGLPVVLTSGYSEQVATAHVAPTDIAGFIQKPFRPAALVRTMHEAVSRGTVPEAV
jgi:CheY-like chemotaxis protein